MEGISKPINIGSFECRVRGEILAEENKAVADPNAPKYRRLRKWNLVMGTLHLIQGLIMLLLTKEVWVPITTNFFKFDQVNQQVISNYDTLFKVPLGPMIALFMFMSAIAHYSVSTFGYSWYVRNISKGMNPARWYEYAISSSLMIVIIAILSGLNDAAALILLVGSNASMNLFGLSMELQNQYTTKTSWTNFVFGSIAGTIAWVAVLMYFFGAAANNFGNIPDFVYVATAILVLFWISFPLNMILQYRKRGRWKDYLVGEKGYIILSLVSKSLLAWILFFGIQARG